MSQGANHAVASHYLEMDFFDHADALRTHIEQACGGNAGDGVGPLSRVDAGEAYSFLMTTADRVFSHGLVLSFLRRLRVWGLENLGARHASTPQIHVYLDGCSRALAPDATTAGHHYLYSLTRADAALVRILGGGDGRKAWLGIGVSRLAIIPLGFNHLLVHPTDLAYAVEAPRGAKSVLGAVILLHGYIW